MEDSHDDIPEDAPPSCGPGRYAAGRRSGLRLPRPGPRGRLPPDRRLGLRRGWVDRHGLRGRAGRRRSDQGPLRGMVAVAGRELRRARGGRRSTRRLQTPPRLVPSRTAQTLKTTLLNRFPVEPPSTAMTISTMTATNTMTRAYSRSPWPVCPSLPVDIPFMGAS